MIVCSNLVVKNGKLQACGKEMYCLKTGMNVWINDNYIYSADLYECPICKARVAVTGASGRHVSDEVDKLVREDELTIIFNHEVCGGG